MRELGGRLAIVLHIYYLDIAERLLSQLRWLASSDRFALWVTVPSGKRADVEALLSRYGLAAQVRDYPNTGMDVLPFLRVLPELAETGYSTVVKLHTKRGTDEASAVWGAALLNDMCRQPVLEAIERAFEQYADLDLAGLGPFYLSAKRLRLSNEQLVTALVRDLPVLPDAPPADWGFFAGTVFGARLERLLPLARWAQENPHYFAAAYAPDGLYEHAFERVFGLVARPVAGAVGLIHDSTAPHTVALQRVSPSVSVNQAYSRELARQVEGFASDYATLSQCDLLDAGQYRLEGEVTGAVDIHRHYLLVGQFDGRVSASKAWSLKRHNERKLPWERWGSARREPDLVSVIIPVFNQPELTEQCIRALFSVRTSVRFEVVCVDNGSEAATGALLARLAHKFPGLRLVSHTTNLNFSLGCNTGFGHSRGARVVFLNNDTTVTDGWLDRLMARLDVGDCFAAQPQLRYPDGTLQCMGVVFSDKSTLGYPIYAKMAPSECAADKPRTFKALTAACLALRADDFAMMKGFDALYVNGQEDVDLCLRLHEHTGKFGAYVPESVVVHHESKTQGRGTWIAQNRRVFAHRWRGRVTADDVDYYRADGFDVVHWQGDRHSDEDGTRIYRPVLSPRHAGSEPSASHPTMGEATLALQAGNYSAAVAEYVRCAEAFPRLRPVLEASLEMVKRVRRLRRKRLLSGVLCLGSRPPRGHAERVDCVLAIGRTVAASSGAGADTYLLPEQVANGAYKDALMAVINCPLDLLYIADVGNEVQRYAELYRLVWGTEVRISPDAFSHGVRPAVPVGGALTWDGQLARFASRH